MSGPLRQINQISDSQLGPQLLHAEFSKSYLIMEDLTPRGYVMANRRTGLDLPHSLLAIRSIARFHAASVAVCEKVNFNEYSQIVCHQCLSVAFLLKFSIYVNLSSPNC